MTCVSDPTRCRTSSFDPIETMTLAGDGEGVRLRAIGIDRMDVWR